MTPQIVQVYPSEEYKVYVYFEDGKIVYKQDENGNKKPVIK